MYTECYLNEIWKDIAGYEGMYQVSNFGRVRSLNYRNTGRIEIRKTFIMKNGYESVSLCKNQKYTSHYVHRLVASAFVENPNNLLEVNHINEDKLDNRAENLEWCDRSYNMAYGTGHMRSAEKQTGRTNTKSNKKVAQYTMEGELVTIYPSASEIKRVLGYNRGHVCECARGICKQAYGFKWRYV